MYKSWKYGFWIGLGVVLDGLGGGALLFACPWKECLAAGLTRSPLLCHLPARPCLAWGDGWPWWLAWTLFPWKGHRHERTSRQTAGLGRRCLAGWLAGLEGVLVGVFIGLGAGALRGAPPVRAFCLGLGLLKG